MTDIQPEIDEIRSFMGSDESFVPERARQAAALYAAACHEANRRLTLCSELLNKGLRSEAIEEAETGPPLLELFAQLDFPDADKWRELAASLGLETPKRLLFGPAAELNQAIAEEKPLEGLMKKHRTLALARASLQERLKVLRQIAECDSDNPIWEEDVRRYERERIVQINRELKSAIKANDKNQLLAIEAEITADGWREEVPGPLKDKIAEIATSAERERARLRLSALEVALNDAIADQDVDAAKRCRAQIRSAIDDEILSSEDPLLEPFQFGMEWIDRKDEAAAWEKEFREKLAIFKEALVDHPLAEVRQQYLELREYGENIPKEVEAIYQDRERERRQTRFVERTASISFAAVIVLGAIAWGVYWVMERSYDKRVADAGNRLEALMQAQSYAEARGFIDTLEKDDRHVANAPSVRAVARSLQEIEDNDRSRSEEFAAVLKSADALPLGDQRETAYVSRLNLLASTPSEKASAAAFAGEREAHLKKLDMATQERSADEIRKQLTDLDKKLQDIAVDTYDARKIRVGREDVAALDRQLALIEGRPQGLLPAAQSDAENLRRKLAAARQELDRSSKEAATIASLTRSLAETQVSFSKHAANLLEAARASRPERRQSFEMAAGEFKSWELILAWENVLSAPAPNFLSLNEAVAAKDRALVLNGLMDSMRDQLQKDRPPVPLPLVIDYADSLQATGNRDACIEEIRKVFSADDVRGIYFLRSAGGKTYYMVDNPLEQVLKAEQLGEAGFIRFRPLGASADIAMKFKEFKEHGPAPQSEIADKVFLDLRRVADTGLDGLYVQIVEQRIKERKGLDPILALFLISKVTEAVSKADVAIAEELKELTKIIEDSMKSGIDFGVPWSDPTRPDANRVRVAAGKLLATLPSMKELPAAVKKRRQALETQLKQSRRKIAGWLYRDPEMGWKVALLERSQSTRDLKVYQTTGEKPPGWVTIGKLVKGDVQLAAESAGALLEGRLVFVDAE